MERWAFVCDLNKKLKMRYGRCHLDVVTKDLGWCSFTITDPVKLRALAHAILEEVGDE